MPYVDVTYEAHTGRRLRKSALVDTGAAWSCIPQDIAAGHFHNDLDSCPRRRIQGPDKKDPQEYPYQALTVQLLGRELQCDILFMPSPLYLIGHIPVFSNFLFAFEENQSPGTCRLLYRA